ncbi:MULTISPECIES: hypothetical protein [Polaribacter]|uniref:hypothetical protein n=1 Tax=Polaribacter TaxID=52959 RepID=UPI0020900E65|nr:MULTISPECIES: hypothetical protein [Polaribacter]MDO6740334.1 hypothetical protein [Polaribacter sp. 1_MG-2023]
MPSLDKINNQQSLSRDTILSAFNQIKNRGIIHSVVDKVYYVFPENIFTFR